MNDVYKSTEEYNLGIKRKVLLVFDYMIADVDSSKEFHPVVTELFISGKKLLHHDIPKKRERLQIFINNSSDTEFDKLKSFYRKCTTEPYILLVFDTTLPSSNLFRYQEFLLESI